MSVLIDTGALTDLVLAHLGTANVLVGDGVAPAEGGWLSGQPGAGVFRPYATLVVTGGVPAALGLDSDFPAWAVGFSLRSFGGSRSQCDAQAALARGAMEGLQQETFGAAAWVIAGVQWQALGAMVRVDASSPPFWQVFDTLALVCSS